MTKRKKNALRNERAIKSEFESSFAHGKDKVPNPRASFILAFQIRQNSAAIFVFSV